MPSYCWYFFSFCNSNFIIFVVGEIFNASEIAFFLCLSRYVCVEVIKVSFIFKASTFITFMSITAAEKNYYIYFLINLQLSSTAWNINFLILNYFSIYFFLACLFNNSISFNWIHIIFFIHIVVFNIVILINIT